MLRAMNNLNDYLVINTTQDLENLCSQLQDSPWLAVDTEFMRESTYFPKLCLLQIATPHAIACIDTISINNVDKLVDLLYDPGIIKVLSCCMHDLDDPWVI